MTMIKHVSASMTKNGPAFYKGQEIHPSVIDEGSDLLSQAMQDKDNLINAHGVKVIPVKKSVDGALPHFRIHDERYQEKLGAFGETIHNRFRDVTFQMLQDDGGKSLHRITAFDGMDRFQYGNCKCESEVDGYRPDVAVFHQDASVKGILALEVIHHSPPSKEKVLSYLDKGHIILRLNIADIVQTWMKHGYVASDQDIANYILQTRYKYPRNINRKYLNDVQLIWIDLLERERQRIKLETEDEAIDRVVKDIWMENCDRWERQAKERNDAKTERDIRNTSDEIFFSMDAHEGANWMLSMMRELSAEQAEQFLRNNQHWLDSIKQREPVRAQHITNALDYMVKMENNSNYSATF